MSEQWPSKEQEIWFQAGVTGEKQRIIKLLDSHRMHLIEYEYFELVETFKELIELIKGETK